MPSNNLEKPMWPFWQIQFEQNSSDFQDQGQDTENQIMWGHSFGSTVNLFNCRQEWRHEQMWCVHRICRCCVSEFVFTSVCFCLCVWVSLVNGVDCDVIGPQINPSSWLLDVSSSRLTRRCRRCSSVLLWQYCIFDHSNVCDQSVTSVTWMCEWWSVFPITADHHVQYAICSRSPQSQEIERQQQ